VNRIQNLRKLMSGNMMEGVLVYSPENRRYLSGFTGSAGFLVIGKESMDFVTDFRYMEQAESQCKGWKVTIHGGNLWKSWPKS
jgi:Xaa-Pro aminopeptidase